MNVLLVDDDPFVLKLLDLQLRNFNLKRWGFTDLVPCAGAAHALALLEAGDPAIGLIFCDLQMPEMDGVEMARHLVRLQYAGALVLISGEDERTLQAAERLARAHRLNVLGALHKPVAADTLQQTLDGLLRAFERTRTTVQSHYPAAQLQQAIGRGELVNHYQPKVDLRTGQVTGVETLARWQHPEGGLIEAEHFLGSFEAHALIDELTREVLSNALLQSRAWRRAGLALNCAVNVSMTSLTDLRFPDFVAGEAAAADVPLSSLVLEVSERQLQTDLRASLDILTRLRLKHTGLSIDDFGTGYTSLAQLRELPLTELKIDRSVVHDAHHSASLRALLDASLTRARETSLDLVAEGVENLDDWNFIRSSGCHSAQGFFIAQPMPGADLPTWIAEWEPRRQSLIGAPP